VTYEGGDKTNICHTCHPVVDGYLMSRTVGAGWKGLLDVVQMSRREVAMNCFGTRSHRRHFREVTRAGRGDTKT
jgi:hypothetical protein